MVQSILSSNSLTIRYIGGLKPDGSDLNKSVKLNKIRFNITDEEIFEVGRAISSLMKYPVVGIGKILEYSLSQF